MPLYYCISKFKDGNNISWYRLLDSNNRVFNYLAEDLKIAIKCLDTKVLNLELTSNNRLISKKCDKVSIYNNIIQNRENRKAYIQKYINKIMLLGQLDKKVKVLYDNNGHPYYIIDNTEYEDYIQEDRSYIRQKKINTHYKYIVYIPDNVTNINNSKANNEIVNVCYMCGHDINLEVVGGSNLLSMYSLFANINALELNLINFDSHNVSNMDATFRNIDIRKLYIELLDTSNVVSMNDTFLGALIDPRGNKSTGIDISMWRLDKIRYADRMFKRTHTWYLNIHNFDRIRLDSKYEMFNENFIKTIDTNNKQLYDEWDSEKQQFNSFYLK